MDQEQEMDVRLKRLAKGMADFFQRVEFHGEVPALSGTETLSVDLLDNPFEGRKYVIRLSHDVTDPMQVTFTDLSPDDCRSLANLLWNAADVADQADGEVRAGISGVRMLSKIKLCGEVFFIDERLRQLRNVENPNHFFDLADPFM